MLQNKIDLDISSPSFDKRCGNLAASLCTNSLLFSSIGNARLLVCVTGCVMCVCEYEHKQELAKLGHLTRLLKVSANESVMNKLSVNFENPEVIVLKKIKHFVLHKKMKDS